MFLILFSILASFKWTLIMKVKYVNLKVIYWRKWGQIRKTDSTRSIFISGIFRNHFQEGELESKIPSWEAGTYSGSLANIHNMCIQNREYWGWDAKVKIHIHTEGNIEVSCNGGVGCETLMDCNTVKIIQKSYKNR